MIDNLRFCHEIFHKALIQSGIQGINVTTTYDSRILLAAEFSQVLAGLRQGRSSPDVAIFTRNKISIHGESISIFWLLTITSVYTNMINLLIDAVYISMKKLGYGDVEIVVRETV
ncbi:glucan endo-1 [Forsythia ovata]|uniref:Glucan endo-1 n=1 Tax=Forsythia ovata TaxID=205694 RepID=A0ABD1WKT3_9LAMI